MTGRVSFPIERHLDDDQMQGLAVTRRRILLFGATIDRRGDWDLWFVGELPLRDVAVIHHKDCGRVMKLFGSESELLVNLRDRTLRVRAGRTDANALANVASSLPNGPPRIAGIPGQ